MGPEIINDMIWVFYLFVFAFLKLEQVSSMKEAGEHSLGPRGVTLPIRAICLIGSGEFFLPKLLTGTRKNVLPHNTG